jgi:hypothetical protein
MNPPRPSDWTAQRRAAAWLNLVLQAVILLALLVVVNLIARRSAKRIDVTAQQTFHLSDATEDALRALPYDIQIWINPLRYEMSNDQSLQVAVLRTQNLLEEFSLRTKRIRVKTISPDDKDEMLEFRRHWSTMSPATLYFLATLGTGKTNKKAIEIQQLYEGNSVTGEVTAFRGEAMLVAAIRELAGAVKHMVCESEGHQEYVTGDKSTFGALHRTLTVNEGIEFVRIPLNECKTVPVACELLMIMGPAQPFNAHEIEVIRDYIERGGSLLVAVRPKVRTGIEKLLEEYSVVVGDNVVHDPQQFVGAKMSNLIIRDFNIHDINRSMVNLQFALPDCCTVDPVARKDAEWRITPLAMAGPHSWEKKGELSSGVRSKPEGDERIGNMKLIVVVEKPASHKLDDRHARSKLDVWGSVAPFTNGVLLSSEIQMEYVVNHFRWLTDRVLLDIKPENIRQKPLQLEESQLSQLSWIVLVGFPGFGLALGILAWYVRRK